MPTYTNLTILQGWLEIDSVQTVPTKPGEAIVLQGWIYTTDYDGAEQVFEERHPVLITGRPAEAILEITRKLNEKSHTADSLRLIDLPADNTLPQAYVLAKAGRPYVIAQGKLYSYNGLPRIDVKYISFLGIPWGVLDVLTELGPRIDGDLYNRIATLSPTERIQVQKNLVASLQVFLKEYERDR